MQWNNYLDEIDSTNKTKWLQLGGGYIDALKRSNMEN